MSRLLLSPPPPPPSDGEWTSSLAWMLRVLPPDDRDIGFVASLFQQCLDRPGLTPKQAKWANRILDRVIGEWQEAQSLPVGVSPATLAKMTPAGRA